jgi:hypothetical protein
MEASLTPDLPHRVKIWLLTTASHDHSRSRDEDQQL